jgi:multisubunit Na+/H+ antiporter MnhG subunit
VLLAGLNALSFHARDSLQRLDGAARAQTVVSMGLWLAVIICGRWIAYA